MGYKLVTFQDVGKYTIFKEITEEELKAAQESIRALQKIMICKDYYYIVVDNIDDWQKSLQSCDFLDNKSFTALNRYMYNILGAYYAWVEFYETNYKDIFGVVKKNYYDNYFTYRMIYNLRIYMTHCEMGITQSEINYDKQEVHIYVSPKNLIEKGKSRLQNKVVKELEEMISENKLLDVEMLINDFKDIFTDMNKDLTKALNPKVKENLNFLYDCISKEGKLVQCSFIFDEDKNEVILDIPTYINLFLKKMAS
ncbi:hypothetical protein QA584_04065 [Anaerocolumna sp. AGMB13025]|uniref:hypothetical protein n=1 Tax=Anaerocolumna sp. AGMB13025 TaxID=3039116 RepID=UPI00241DED03|nr:hypothetical protein [Anaerocolumna sp. AGMB13025]WFR58251.1 hypothetical protein QA584_04065 [Anaerocolumna sp. AGMB13025]